MEFVLKIYDDTFKVCAAAAKPVLAASLHAVVNVVVVARDNELHYTS